MPASFMTSLTETAGDKMAALKAVFSHFQTPSFNEEDCLFLGLFLLTGPRRFFVSSPL